MQQGLQERNRKTTKAVDKSWRKLVHLGRHHGMQYLQSKPTHIWLLITEQKDDTDLSPNNKFWAHVRRLGIVLPQKAK